MEGQPIWMPDQAWSDDDALFGVVELWVRVFFLWRRQVLPGDLHNWDEPNSLAAHTTETVPHEGPYPVVLCV